MYSIKERIKSVFFFFLFGKEGRKSKGKDQKEAKN